MALLDLGMVKPGSTIYIPFHTFSSNDPSASVAIAAFIAGDIEVYKNGGTTQRASDSGYTLLDTDGIDFDSHVGIGGFSIDLADNSTAEFWQAGEKYFVVVGPTTIDAAVINFVAVTFEIGYLQAFLNTSVATLASQTSFTLDVGPADDDALNGCSCIIHDVASLVQIAFGNVDDYTGSTKTVTLKTDPGIFTMAATDNVSFFPPPNANPIWDKVLTGATHNVANSAGRRLRQIQEAGGYTGSAIYLDTVNGTAGTTDFENGVDTKPVDSIADANTLATSLGIARFIIAPGSSITFAAAQENQEFIGDLWTLALGGQSVSGSHIFGAKVSGTGTSATEAHYEHCEMGDSTIGKAHVESSDLEGTLTLSAATTYIITDCHHSGTPIIDFGAAVANTTVHMHMYSGAVTIKNMGQSGTDILHFDSPGGKLTLDSTNTGGTKNLNGTFELADSSTGQTTNKGGLIIDLVPTALVGSRMDSDIGAKTGNVALSAQEKLDVNAEAKDVIATDTTGEPGQEAPAAALSLIGKVDRLYKAWRNKKDNDGTTSQLFNDAGTVVDSKQSTSEAAGTVTKAEWVTGP